MKGIYFLLAIALMPLMLTAQMRQMNWVLGQALPTDTIAYHYSRLFLKFSEDGTPPQVIVQDEVPGWMALKL